MPSKDSNNKIYIKSNNDPDNGKNNDLNFKFYYEVDFIK
jgi:hypothetical protein